MFVRMYERCCYCASNCEINALLALTKFNIFQMCLLKRHTKMPHTHLLLLYLVSLFIFSILFHPLSFFSHFLPFSCSVHCFCSQKLDVKANKILLGTVFLFYVIFRIKYRAASSFKQIISFYNSHICLLLPSNEIGSEFAT